MNEADLKEIEKAEQAPFATRVRHSNWNVRKRAYQLMLQAIGTISTANAEVKLGNQFFTLSKFASILNNLVEQKHPHLVLQGLECVETVLHIDPAIQKQFNKLIFEGLQKFPLVSQQRKIILQKFLDILQLCKIEASTLHSRLALPHQKSVMFVIQIIGALGVSSLKKKLVEISKKHPKVCVKELAAEIAEQLEDEQPVKTKQQPKLRAPQQKLTPERQEMKKGMRGQLIEKIQHFQQLTAKQQQKYSDQLLQCIDEIAVLPSSGHLSNFCYYLQLMIEDNNLIISTNGIKMLTALVKIRSQLIPVSFPLLFIIRKFKMHKTHPLNTNLLYLVNTLLCSARSTDLMNAILEGMGSLQTKVNLKYGCTICFIRIFCYSYNQEKLFNQFCQGEFDINIIERIENKKYIDKILGKCFELFSKEKDREYASVVDQMKEVLGMPINNISLQKTVKSDKNELTVMTKNKNSVISNVKPQKTLKQGESLKSLKSVPVISPEGQLNKILQLLQSNKINSSVITKSISKCLQSTSSALRDQLYDTFFYCEIIQNFIDNYRPHEESDSIVSQFLIDYLKLVSGIQVKASKKGSRVTQSGIQYLLKISTAKLVLSKQLLAIISNVNANFGYETVLKSLGSLYVLGRQVAKKKNKKYLLRWLEENTPEKYIDRQYFELKDAIQNNCEKPLDILKKQIVIANYEQIKEQNKKQEIMIKKPLLKKVGIETIVKVERKEQYTNVIEERSMGFQSKFNPNTHESKPKYQTNYKEQRSAIQEQSLKSQVQMGKLSILQGADISTIQKVEQQEHDKLDERWEYFLNKRTKQTEEHIRQPKHQESHNFVMEQEKFNSEERIQEISDEEPHFNYYEEDHHPNGDVLKSQKQLQTQNDPKFRIGSENIMLNNKQQSIQLQQSAEIAKKEKKNLDNQLEQEVLHESQQEDHHNQNQKGEFSYQYINKQKIGYMLSNSNNPFNHLRTLVLLPFKSHHDKHAFLRELTHLIQMQQAINKPQPFNSLLLLIILLFTQIKSDKSIIEPLQYLYEFMAQQCNNNQFLKIIISLYHSVIDQSQQNQRKLLLTILTKSMARIMPFVQNSLQLLRDLQQFYQIGEMFEMFVQQYEQIKNVIEHSQGLEQVVRKAYEEEGGSLKPIIEGWLETGFKQVVRNHISGLLGQENEQEQIF